MLLTDLRSASFKGARFLVPHDEVEEGRNAVRHEYPDASHRYVEDNGRIPPRFTISALVHGGDVAAKTARLRSALMSPGPGVLKHPWAGTQFVQVEGPYRVRREDRQAGIVEFEITFAVTGAPVLPGIVSGVAALVTGLASSAVSSMFSAFSSKFGGASGGVSATRLADNIASVASVLDARTGSSSDAASKLITRAGQIVRDPAYGVPFFIEAFRAPFDDDTLSNPSLVTAFKDAHAAAKSVSLEADAILPTTADLIRRKKDMGLLGATLEAASFASLADAMAGRTYLTGDDVDADEALLADVFGQVQSRELDQDTHAELTKIYTATSEVLRDVAVRLPRLSQIDIQSMPASVLAYHLYESDADLMTLVSLNLDKDPILFAGSTSVLVS